MNCFKKLLDYEQQACRARCRIKAWRVTERQALYLSEDISMVEGRSPLEIYEAIKSGTAHLFDARIVLR